MTEKKPLPVAEPESVGIPSEAVMKLLNRLEKAKINLHGYLIIRNGKIVSEGYVPPFDRSFRHRLYSVSKSFVSGAVGLLIGEGRLSLEDHVADYFKDLLPEHPDERVMRATVEDLLTMRSPFCWPTYCTDAPRNFVDDWAGSFFNTPCDREPGTSFKYDTSATFILDALVERVTGMPFLDYMKEKIFREIGISDDIWCVKSPDGYSWGGSGVMGTVRELAKYALLFLRGGCWEGKQLIPEWYVKRAVSPIVETHSDTGSHYGYQIWCTRDGSFSFHGMGHQIAVCVPDKDIVFVCCADDQGPDAEEKNAEIYSALFEEVVYAAKDEALPENAASYARLCERNASLKPPVVEGEADSPKALAVNGKTFRMTGIAGGITEMKLSFSDGVGVFEYINGDGKGAVRFGFGHHEYGEFSTSKYFGDQIGKPAGYPYKISANGAWTSPDVLEVRVFSLSNFIGNFWIRFAFGGDSVRMKFSNHSEWFFNEFKGNSVGRMI